MKDGVLEPLIAGGLGLANLVNLEELALCSVERRAIAVALGHVGDKRTTKRMVATRLVNLN